MAELIRFRVSLRNGSVGTPFLVRSSNIMKVNPVIDEGAGNAEHSSYVRMGGADFGKAANICVFGTVDEICDAIMSPDRIAEVKSAKLIELLD